MRRITAIFYLQRFLFHHLPYLLKSSNQQTQSRIPNEPTKAGNLFGPMNSTDAS